MTQAGILIQEEQLPIAAYWRVRFPWPYHPNCKWFPWNCMRNHSIPRNRTRRCRNSEALLSLWVKVESRRMWRRRASRPNIAGTASKGSTGKHLTPTYRRAVVKDRSLGSRWSNKMRMEAKDEAAAFLTYSGPPSHSTLGLLKWACILDHPTVIIFVPYKQYPHCNRVSELWSEFAPLFLTIRRDYFIMYVLLSPCI